MKHTRHLLFGKLLKMLEKLEDKGYGFVYSECHDDKKDWVEYNIDNVIYEFSITVSRVKDE